MGTSSRSSSTLKNPFQTIKSFYTIQPTTRTIRMKFILMLSLTVLVASQVVTSLPTHLCESFAEPGTAPSPACLALISKIEAEEKKIHQQLDSESQVEQRLHGLKEQIISASQAVGGFTDERFKALQAQLNPLLEKLDAQVDASVAIQKKGTKGLE